METLIQRGVDIDARNKDQGAPLDLATVRGHQHVLNILLAAGANVHSVNNEVCTALYFSVANGHKTISKALLKKGNCKINRNLTPFNVAATISHNEKTIQLLLKYGADVDRKWQHSVEFYIFCRRQFKTVDGENNVGQTALHLAAHENHKVAVNILLKYGADVIHLDSTGSSVLGRVAENNNKDL